MWILHYDVLANAIVIFGSIDKNYIAIGQQCSRLDFSKRRI